MALGTTFNEYDQSIIEELSETTEAVEDSVVTMSAAATRKGTEVMGEYSGKAYLEMFGEGNFAKYGQVSIQNQKIIEAGGKILFQRLVADDAKLANIIVVAKMYKTEVQATNAQGDPLYYDENHNETTDATHPDPLGGSTPIDNEKIMVSTAHVKYDIHSDDNAKTPADVVTFAATLLDADGTEEEIDPITHDKADVFSYPIMYYCDNGRGVSDKRISIVPEHTLSKNQKFMYYTLNVYEEGATIEDNCTFSVVPGIVVNKQRIDLTAVMDSSAVQVRGGLLDDNMDAYLEKLADFSDYDIDDLKELDPIFGTTRKGANLKSIVVDEIDGAELNSDIGIELANGDDGAFTDSPYKKDETKGLVEAKMLKFYQGEINQDIYNVDLFHVNAIFDADFTLDVKQAIFELVDWRKDAMFFRDFGTKCQDYSDVAAYKETLAKSSYVVDFCQAYEIFDDISYSTAMVTIMYSIAPLLVNHLYDGGHLPFAGQRYSAVITDIRSKESINFIPKKLPTVDEKSDMEDIQVNFGSYFNSDFVIETVYTSDDNAVKTQLSYYNNRYAVNQVIIGLRTYFPAIRYQYVTSLADIESYAALVNEYLEQFAGNFSELNFSYDSGTKYLNNKIFKARLEFRFNNFLQSEIVDAYMLPTGSL